MRRVKTIHLFWGMILCLTLFSQITYANVHPDDYLKLVQANSGKPAVVFIHGHGNSPAAWDKIFERLRGLREQMPEFMKSYNVYTFTYDTDNWDIGYDGYILKTALDNKGISNPYIVAHSMGGLVARAYVKEGGSVAKLVTFASPHTGSSIQGCTVGGIFRKGIKDMCIGSDFLNILNSDTRERTFRNRYVLWAGEEGETTWDGKVNTQSAWLCYYSCDLQQCDSNWRETVEEQGQLSLGCQMLPHCAGSIRERRYAHLSHDEFLDPDKNRDGFCYIAKHLASFDEVPIYRYHVAQKTGGWRFHYATDTTIEKGWTLDGVAFYGAAATRKGAKPVYRYHKVLAGGGWNFRYSTSPDIGGEWTPDGVKFYAFSSKRDDAVPVYQYHAKQGDKSKRYHYSTNPEVGHGWTRDEIVFYAPKLDVSPCD